jgi:hypothetical protein
METGESKDRFGYCDVHLESKLVPAASLFAGQYGGDQADCYPFKYWRCSRPECSRCYDETMHGYFNLDRQPGGSIQANQQRQQTCGRHPETPFMVIGKFAQGRKFRCPFHGCGNVGPMVAEHVADADADEPEEPPATEVLAADSRKEAFELSVFEEFAKAAYISMESPENAKPPRPDIRCRIDGEEYWFELGRITDTKLARAISVEWPKAPTPFSIAQKEPFVRMIEKKAAAQYETNGQPVDLVLYFDQQPPDRKALERHLQEDAAALNDLHQRGPFSRIWIYGRWSKSMLWKSP